MQIYRDSGERRGRRQNLFQQAHAVATEARCPSRGGLLPRCSSVHSAVAALLQRCCRAVPASTQFFSVFGFFFFGVSSPEEVDSDSEVEGESASAFFFDFLFLFVFSANLPFFLSSLL